VTEAATDNLDLEVPFKDCENDYQLENLALFQGVEPESIRAWIADCSLKWFKAGSTVLSPDTENRSLLLVLDGRASIHLKSGDSEAIARVAAGECLGEVSLFDTQSPTAVVVAETDLHILVISHEQLFRMIEWSHQVSRNLLYILSQRLRYCNEAIGESVQFQEGLKDEAKRDALTGLYNREWLDIYLSKLDNNAALGVTMPELSLLIIDIENLHWYGENYGDLARQEVLRQVAKTVGKEFRSTDKIARYDDARFMVILPGTGQDAAASIAARLRDSITGTPIENGPVTYPSPEASIAVAGVPQEGNLADLIETAASRLKEVRQDGGDQVQVINL